jgi:signal transduction histidine kinase
LSPLGALNGLLRAGASPGEVLARLCVQAGHTAGAQAVHLLDARSAIRASAGPSVGVDGDLAARVMATGRPARIGRVLYLPLPGPVTVPGALVAVGRRRAPHPGRLEQFAPLAALLLPSFCEHPDSSLRERERLARDLHDSVVQTLYGISLGAGTAAELMHGNPAHAQASLAWIQETAAAGLTDLRGIILRLRPETLVGAGLATALKGLLEALHTAPGRDGVPTGWGLQLDADPVVSPEVEEALYRIALEALGNAARHAGASQVTLRLSSDDTRVVLEVVDDGVGFTLEAPHPGRLGVRSMRERAALVGGVLDILTAPGAGTVIRATLPTGG